MVKVWKGQAIKSDIGQQISETLSFRISFFCFVEKGLAFEMIDRQKCPPLKMLVCTKLMLIESFCVC